MRVPYPYFGGKSYVMPEVWRRFGEVDRFIDPFLGGGSALLLAPWPAKRDEIVNDKDGLLTNFWRAAKYAPDEVVFHAGDPVNEIDLHSRHQWLVTQRADVERMLAEPEYYDAKAAGWWWWGVSQWIGSGWCAPRAGRKVPNVSHVKGATAIRGQKPLVTHATGTISLSRQKPLLSHEKGAVAIAGGGGLAHYMQQLTERLSNVWVMCGDWARCITPAVLDLGKGKITAVFLDPPYSLSGGRMEVYAKDDTAGAGAVADEVRKWALDNGDNPALRIALCGYVDDHDDYMPPTWERLSWTANGGYSLQGETVARERKLQETVWFSPGCRLTQPRLFEE